ncbi:MAG: DinB family protein [Bellilinea sp.]
MKKIQVIDKLEQAWKDFQGSFSGLSDAEIVKQGVTGAWSVKDIIAHVSWWEEETLKHLPEVLQGIRPQRYSMLYGGIDAFNALMTEKWRSFTLAEVRKQSGETHRKLLEYLKAVPEEHFTSESRFRRRLRLDTYSHYPIHTQAILSWRGKTA